MWAQRAQAGGRTRESPARHCARKPSPLRFSPGAPLPSVPVATCSEWIPSSQTVITLLHKSNDFLPTFSFCTSREARGGTSDPEKAGLGLWVAVGPRASPCSLGRPRSPVTAWPWVQKLHTWLHGDERGPRNAWELTPSESGSGVAPGPPPRRPCISFRERGVSPWTRRCSGRLAGGNGSCLAPWRRGMVLGFSGRGQVSWEKRSLSPSAAPPLSKERLLVL